MRSMKQNLELQLTAFDMENIKSAGLRLFGVRGEGEKTFGISTTYQFFYSHPEFKNQHTEQLCKSALHTERDEAGGDGKVTAKQYYRLRITLS